ncbi:MULTISPECIES: DUF4328 domain-containing protein [unclassified Streptomyces]|jgi:hypothetical protein|uniref:DUF4328 domain-containing protein n=1 Tax=unclassified Streptomyces TaxID=2593676 RepID=UPI00088E2F4B|nr:MULTISPECIES: DUF4328 domain-containing protein [unclassified Streptomyces]MDX2732641.1 DUF4328 domain-containing protein [Streptomyces sp. PA03-2a]MDX3770349.1 DUF4328 domain-containing protein [Streptomyces sp. AK08-01B]MDX3819620.1 DUF4328 domain-containing protein [Streptomyces sp. AK08-01A]SCZ13533.1 protein of unknown function [Streptomyces sp. 136MFCol5.1]SFT31349.1 protein of unknown function [Streptomyces sp. ok210]
MTRPSDAVPRSPQSLARAAQILVGLYALLDPSRPKLFDATDDGLFYSRYVSASALVGLATLVTFLLWFRRCRYNAQALSVGPFAHTPGWAVGAWFTPVLMWWRPRRIALDIHRAVGHDPATDTTVTLINAWWAAWIAHMVAAVTATSTSYADSVVLSVVSQALYLIAAVFVILVIQRMTAAQTRAVAAYAPARVPAA